MSIWSLEEKNVTLPVVRNNVFAHKTNVLPQSYSERIFSLCKTVIERFWQEIFPCLKECEWKYILTDQNRFFCQKRHHTVNNIHVHLYIHVAKALLL